MANGIISCFIYCKYFFFINSRLLILNCKFLCLEFINAFISLIIFLLKKKKNEVEIEKIRTYYYLYCFIYESLNKNYPRLEYDKKYILRFYRDLLETGYAIEFISVSCNLCYYALIAIYDECCRCGCKCDECKVKNCLNCSKIQKICKTYIKFDGNNCSCQCVECQNKRCFYCKGKYNYCLDYCDYCCYKSYCEINKEIKKYERIVGFIFDLPIIFVIIFLLKMIFSPSDLDDVAIDSSNYNY